MRTPFTFMFNRQKLEAVQRKTDRFVKKRYRMHESLLAMLNNLCWHLLAEIQKKLLVLF